MLGWLGQVGQDVETFGDRVRLFARHFNLVSRGELLNLEPWGESVAFVRTPIVARHANSVQAQDVTLMEATQIFRSLLGTAWAPQAIHLTHRPTDERPYHEAFRCPIHFDAPVQAIQLRAEATSFTELFEETRKELATYFVGNTSLSLTAISELLGYSDATAFSRSFRRWFGSSPSRWRKRISRPRAYALCRRYVPVPPLEASRR